LDWREHVASDQKLFRPSDIDWSQGDASRAKACLGWEAHTRMPELVQLMVEAARADAGIVSRT
jgi:GDPmannose 4,6-dehydratase